MNDLLAVINGWGPCVGQICGHEDINTDAEVDVNDLLAVINAWGPCGGMLGDAPESVEDCEARCADEFPGGGNDYAACVSDCVKALCATGVLPPEDSPD